MASSSSSNSPCAACKLLRRKCQPECVFAPYFPPDQPQKFANVHKVFGASNVTKLLNELHPHQREDAVNSLAYEADMRLRDPVYGCVGVISLLQHQIRQLQMDLTCAKSELSKFQDLQGSITSHGLIAAAVHHRSNSILSNQYNFLSSSSSSAREINLRSAAEHQQQQMMMRSTFDAAAGVTINYDAGSNLLAMNVSGGIPYHHHQPAARAAAAHGDDHRRTIGPS